MRIIADALQKLVQQILGEPDEQLQQWRSQLLKALGSNGQIIIDVIPEIENARLYSKLRASESQMTQFKETRSLSSPLPPFYPLLQEVYCSLLNSSD